jgi:CNT family concentrative nucleoside transporter
MGMTEAPLLVRPYLAAMTRSELLAVMVGGLATISGSMMAVYSALFGVEFSFLLGASVLSAPAALYLTKLYLPEEAAPATLGAAPLRAARETANVVDAAASGATVGLQLALNVGAMLLAFSAGLAFIDAVLGWAGGFFLPAGETLSLGRILGWIFLPLAWLIGVPAAEAGEVGRLLGLKVALNEYFAYQSLAETALSPRARGIAAFALCGFANFGSIAVLLGGLGGLVPERRAELARLGIPAMVLAALANCLSAAIAGLIVEFPA